MKIAQKKTILTVEECCPLSSKITLSGGIDSGNDHNYCSSDTSTKTTSPRVVCLSSGGLEEDQKRIEYQEMILKKMMAEKNSKITNFNFFNSLLQCSCVSFWKGSFT